jgi:cytochrome c-type biogenesis protein CcmH/NrfF
MTCALPLPLAHVGHWLWVFYVLPVVIVVAGILYSTLAERRRRRHGEKERS